VNHVIFIWAVGSRKPVVVPGANQRQFTHLNAVHVCALGNKAYTKSKKCTNVKNYILHTIYQKSEMFWSILIIFRELLNINKTDIKSWMDY
jgi:hypothetical protein